MPWSRRHRDRPADAHPARPDDGSATIEFVFLVVALIVPIAYILITVLALQRAAYGATQAAREAARGYVTTPDGGDGETRARAAATLALADQGLDHGAVTITFECTASPCLTPTAQLTVRVTTTVALPWVPDVLGQPAAAIPVVASHTETVDPYTAVRP